MRRFLKSDEDMVPAVQYRIRHNPDDHGVINYITCQDGFTLNDLVSYNYKHNEANGEGNNDGCSYNYSWNCGIEGPSRKAVDPSDEGAPDACCFCHAAVFPGSAHDLWR
ncbi:MAG: hypothetical protein ACLU4P_08265 [Ruminococcus sp.]